MIDCCASKRPSAWKQLETGPSQDSVPSLTITQQLSLAWAAFMHYGRSATAAAAAIRVELGHVSMGTLAAGATLGMCFDGAPWAYWITLTGCFMVFVSVAFVLSKIACWPLSKLAHVSQKTPIWAAVFKVYLLLMLLQMAVIGVLLIFELNGV
eukprot:CAMPEP_0181238412 /NCGR_PEP_ID=MMETSP1096-20121128/39332_1 /TAXON_ID=156174 ORGANISM="Chrysochromulina ericina, Strain CCMP281" /NCGR_SAMPLE_ID=MMETSP1096 /ASSEMBLY_ACC=CAM_ASM_000453 /LENGTH=152 /DNA_ID=CAMNT_0023333931 /DNA_START=80 /DNA_END=537 /DNA_ORIENTATION=+